MNKLQGLSASVLPSVLVAATLVLWMVLAVLSLWDMEIWQRARVYERMQERAYMESAFTLYEVDSTLPARLEQNGRTKLYEEEDASWVSITVEPWGLFEVVTVETMGGIRQSRMFGDAEEREEKGVLFVPGQEHVLSLAGYTRVEGDVYLPRGEVAYAELRSLFFEGVPLRSDCIHSSPGNFPVLRDRVEEEIEVLFRSPGREDVPGKPLWVSFADAVWHLQVPSRLSGVSISGRVVLHASDSLFVENDNYLENVILVARKVRISDGLKGCLQIFARDTIIVGDEVMLFPGSGLWVGGKNGEGHISIGDDCEVNGFVIVARGRVPENSPAPHYRQPASARVRGLVYVEGIADVRGTVTGSCYVRAPYYFTPEGYYAFTLFGACLLSHEEVAYPFWMVSSWERREIKCVD